MNSSDLVLFNKPSLEEKFTPVTFGVNLFVLCLSKSLYRRDSSLLAKNLTYLQVKGLETTVDGPAHYRERCLELSNKCGFSNK